MSFLAIILTSKLFRNVAFAVELLLFPTLSKKQVLLPADLVEQEMVSLSW